MDRVFITDVTLRDAHQCLIATRLKTEDMLPICEKLDKVGFWALEVWGGATFDACLRFLKEDPWQRLRDLRSALPNTKLSMLLRGQNLLGYRHYADDVVKAFVKNSAAEGIDVFRVFDALNDVRNLQCAIQAVKEEGKHAQGAISYTKSPVHKLSDFVKLAKELAHIGCDSLAIKDMAGLLTPLDTVALVSELQEKIDLPIHLHSHSTSGLSDICLFKAVEQGVRHIDTAISSFSGGASHPATESMVAAFKETKFDTGLELEGLLEIGKYFREVRQKYQQFESRATDIDPQVQYFQVPGGMISNLSNQLKEQNALDRLDEVHQEIPKVRKDLGYPPLVTPSSQIVGTQAVMNVLSGRRYDPITNEVKLYLQGKYGKAPGNVSDELLKIALGKESPITTRPADLLPNELNTLQTEIGGLALSMHDVLSYALFPEIARTYLQERRDGTLKPEALQPVTNEGTKPIKNEFTVSMHGESYHVFINGHGTTSDGNEVVYLCLDGMPEEVIIEQEQSEESFATNSKSTRTLASLPGDVTVAMPSTVIEIKTSIGSTVCKGEPLLVVEAMKMETEIAAPIDGLVSAILCKKGDVVNPKEALIVIDG